MSVEKLERVMWRLRQGRPDSKRHTNNELKLAIMHECGTDPETIQRNRAALKSLQWIKVSGSKHILVTDKDING